MEANDGYIENEIRFIYTVQVSDDVVLNMRDGEVSKLLWKPRDVFIYETAHDEVAQQYVPHGLAYFALVDESIRAHAAEIADLASSAR